VVSTGLHGSNLLAARTPPVSSTARR
jgi:hypothetical protein